MSEWEKQILGNIANVQTGPFGSQLKNEQYIIGGTPVITVEHITNFKIANINYPSVKEEDRERLSKYSLQEGDIVFSRVGSVDLSAYVNQKQHGWIFSSRMLRVRPNTKIINARFLSFFFRQKSFREYILSISVGATMPSINTEILKGVEISFPPLPEQKAIADVLSALDDKIDLLHRQNHTLEQMAETLFRQWFVEEAQEDWEEVELQDVAERITDGSHSSPPSIEQGYSMASVKDMLDWSINEATCRKISKEDFDMLVKADCKARKGDILIAKDGSYLKHVFLLDNDLDVVLLSSIAMIRPNHKFHPMLLTIYLKLKSTREEMENIVTGAVIPRIVLKDFRKFLIKLPPYPLQQKAIEVIEPIYAKCWNNVRQIQTLETLRDTLLPKLISGEVRVNVQAA